MSSPGQIPPNIIKGSGTQSRAQIIEEQQQLQAQQAQQAQLDAQRAQQEAQAKRDAAAQRPVSSSGPTDELIERSRSNAFLNESYQRGTLIKDLQAAGVNVDYVTFTKDSNGNIDFGSLKGFQFVPAKNNGQPSSPTAESSQAPAPETPVFGSLTLSQAKAAFQNPYKPDYSATEAGYTRLQAAQQQVGEYYTKPIFGSLTASQAANALYIPNEQVQEKVMAANLNNAVSPKKQYQVNLEDRLSGGPYRYEVNLNDSLSGVKPESSPQPRTATAATEPNFLEGLIAGGGNYVNDIPKNFFAIGEKITGGEVKQTFAPSVEGAFMGAIGKAGQDVSQGKPLTLGQDFGEIGKEIGESPGYATGSLIGSAAFIAATAGAGELPGLAIKGVRALVGLGKAASVERNILPTIQRAMGEEGKIGIDADKIVSIGTEGTPAKVSVMRATTTGALKEPAQEIFHSYPLEAPKTAGKINPDLIFGKPERVTQYAQTFVKIGDKEIPLSAVKKGASPVLEQAEIPKGYIQSEAPQVIKGTNVFDIEKGAQGENLFIKTQPYEKIVGTSETVKNTELAQFVKSDVNVKKLIGTYNEDLTRITPSGKPPSTPLKFESPQQAITAEQVRTNFTPSAGGGGGGPANALNKGISAGVAKSLGSFGKQQASNRGVSLGLGGVTGAERKNSKGLVEDVTTEILRTPKSSTKSITEQFTGQFSTPNTRTSTKSITESLSNLGQFPKIDMGQSQSEKNLIAVLPRLGLNQSLGNKSIIDQLSKTIEMPATASVTKTSLDLSTTQEFTFERTPVPKVDIPNIRLFSFEFPFGMSPTPKKKKGRKKELGYGERSFKRTDIVANSVGGEIAKLLNQAIGKVE